MGNSQCDCLCLDVADQDGIGEDEEAALKKIAQALQLPLDQYL
ncbi:TPA: tciA domain protein [Klebsiella pneumoniae]|nr:tciA domain protein [Klebsiella pneumoniae]HBY6599136.1 tciA domain protein [Klebsiella pneumoniae]